MCIKKNPPSIWLTINPADTQDPVALVLCGDNINLDNFCALDHRPADVMISSDPYASASFFHLIINALLDSLFGIQGFKHNNTIERQTGILGDVAAYIGTVEAQGRGTLHLHMLIWLVGSGTAREMKDCLLTEDFRTKVRSFISTNICADLPDFSGPNVLSIPQQSAVAFSQPVDPRLPNYEARQKEAEKRITRTVQIHQCGQSCVKYVKGLPICKRNAPFPLALDDWIDESGKWGPKRTYGYFNNWCPAILQSIRANHDIKLLTNGVETKDIAWYITHYVAKKQNNSSNTSALLAKTFAFHCSNDKTSPDLFAMNKKMLQCCANSLTRQQELSAPEVISYLMGWGDRFVSHHFETVPWYPVLSLLKRTYPVLANETYRIPIETLLRMLITIPQYFHFPLVQSQRFPISCFHGNGQSSICNMNITSHNPFLTDE